ncbi:FAD synthetase family protein [Alteribacter keqinensis]|uniref:FAD synthase n=1 Tax=Alteribacter keqinensis TaxID=2483800 RepID=A0A3M7TPY6_9BACI|nr:FAD synthetase family protein [Alteribacter keqinensis]RNA67077.1 FAD synthetase [Alteribacter keqinensis]
MNVYGNACTKEAGCVMAIGAFDGVHRGHQEIIRKMIRKSELLGIPSAVFTFDPPPKAFFRAADVLTPVGEKVRRIKKLGVDTVIVASFDRAYTERTASQFILDLSAFSPREIYVGGDFRFGKNRAGDVGLLSTHYIVNKAETICCDKGAVISSTRIRGLMKTGKRKEAVTLLGWPV